MATEKRWRVLAALCVARIGIGFQFQSVAAIAPLLAESQGFDTAQIGWLVGVYLLPGAAIALPGGMLGARFGDKRMALLGLALMVAGAVGFSLAQGIAEASVARAAMGVGAVILNVLLVKMVTDWFAGKEMVLAMSILVSTWPVGIGIALLTLGTLAQEASWQAAVLATAAMAGVGMASVFFGHRAAPDAAPAQKVDLRSVSRRDWTLICANSSPWMLYNAGYLLVVAFLPIFFVDAGLSLAAAGGLTAINTLLSILSVQAGGWLVQRYGHADQFVYFSLAGLALAIAGVIASSEPLPWMIVLGLVGGLPAGVLASLPASVLRPELRATGTGIFYTIFYAGTAIAPAIAGVLAVRSASSAAPIWMAAACVVAAAAAYLVARRTQRTVAAPGG